VAVVLVTDADDPRIADYRNVPDPALVLERRLFVAEGRQVVRRLLAANRLVTRSVMVTAAALDALGNDVDRDATSIFLVPQTVMDMVTGFNIHRGCLALGERPAPLDWRALARGAGRLAILERIANADNVGAIFRNAMAFGVDAVLLGPDCSDPLYRKAIRTSMSATLAMPFAHVEPWPGGLRELRNGITVIGLSPCAGASPIRDVVTTARGRIAIVVGHEGDGLTREVMNACDTVARIPMAPGVDSLNVATAVAIALYELAGLTETERTELRTERAEAPVSQTGKRGNGDERIKVI
jgi:tRNA G18 (ribose-2'-O)-methylase SpoU